MASGPANVVIVPGFGGSTLSYAGGSGGKTKYWYNPRIILSSNPLVAALATDGVSPYPVLGKKLSPDGPVDLGLYEPLITALANGGQNATFWAYDWRMDAATLGGQLAAFLGSSAVSPGFQLVCHSYGGLVAQMAYPLYQAANPSKAWGKSIYVCTPHGGSYWAAAALGGWFPSGSELALLGGLFNLTGPVGFGLKQTIVTATMIALGQMVGSWPGLYDLLPNTNGPWASIDPHAPDLFLPSTYAESWGGQQLQWFQAATSVLEQLVTQLGTPRPSELCLAGDGYSTLHDYHGEPANPGTIQSYGADTGDGTVPYDRALLPGSIPSTVFDATGHNELIRSAAGTNAILAALNAAPPLPSPVPFLPPSTIPFPNVPPAPLLPINRNPFGNIHADP